MQCLDIIREYFKITNYKLLLRLVLNQLILFFYDLKNVFDLLNLLNIWIIKKARTNFLLFFNTPISPY